MIVAGFGFRGGASVDSLRDALARARAAAHVAVPPARIATAADKTAAPVFAALSRALGAAVCPVAAPVLAACPTPTQSAWAIAERGTGSLAEAAALVTAGPGATLLTRRMISTDRMASCALAVCRTKGQQP